MTAQAQQLKQQLRGALVAEQWRGDTALTLPLFWRRSLRSFLGSICGRAFTLSSPYPPVPAPNKPPCFCGLKAKWSVHSMDPIFTGNLPELGNTESIESRSSSMCPMTASCVVCWSAADAGVLGAGSGQLQGGDAAVQDRPQPLLATVPPPQGHPHSRYGLEASFQYSLCCV